MLTAGGLVFLVAVGSASITPALARIGARFAQIDRADPWDASAEAVPRRASGFAMDRVDPWNGVGSVGAAASARALDASDPWGDDGDR